MSVYEDTNSLVTNLSSGHEKPDKQKSKTVIPNPSVDFFIKKVVDLRQKLYASI